MCPGRPGSIPNLQGGRLKPQSALIGPPGPRREITVPFSLLLDRESKNDMSGTSLRLSLTFPLPKHRAQPSPARAAAAKPSCRDNLRPVRPLRMPRRAPHLCLPCSSLLLTLRASGHERVFWCCSGQIEPAHSHQHHVCRPGPPKESCTKFTDAPRMCVPLRYPGPRRSMATTGR